MGADLGLPGSAQRNKRAGRRGRQLLHAQDVSTDPARATGQDGQARFPHAGADDPDQGHARRDADGLLHPDPADADRLRLRHRVHADDQGHEPPSDLLHVHECLHEGPGAQRHPARPGLLSGGVVPRAHHVRLRHAPLHPLRVAHRDEHACGRACGSSQDSVRGREGANGHHICEEPPAVVLAAQRRLLYGNKCVEGGLRGRAGDAHGRQGPAEHRGGRGGPRGLHGLHLPRRDHPDIERHHGDGAAAPRQQRGDGEGHREPAEVPGPGALEHRLQAPRARRRGAPGPPCPRPCGAGPPQR
mmetsp:Transcript_45386/g.128365  ORF Transcript_45386/g.128365 Transcript_45386/m.128365 type:complete len:301 (-) Transcript_45386:111-1013(-)